MSRAEGVIHRIDKSGHSAREWQAQNTERFHLRKGVLYLHFTGLMLTDKGADAWSGTERQGKACMRQYSVAADCKLIPVLVCAPSRSQWGWRKGMNADAILKDAFRRWLNIEEAKEAAQEDGKELMAELKGNGFLNTKAVRAAFRRERMAENADAVAKDEAFEAEVDMIRASLARDTHVRAA